MKLIENPLLITVKTEGKYDQGEEIFVFCTSEKEFNEIFELEGREGVLKELLKHPYDLKTWYNIRKIKFQYPDSGISWTWEF